MADDVLLTETRALVDRLLARYGKGAFSVRPSGRIRLGFYYVRGCPFYADGARVKAGALTIMRAADNSPGHDPAIRRELERLL